jgi:hypothetical protein
MRPIFVAGSKPDFIHRRTVEMEQCENLATSLIVIIWSSGGVFCSSDTGCSVIISSDTSKGAKKLKKFNVIKAGITGLRCMPYKLHPECAAILALRGTSFGKIFGDWENSLTSLSLEDSWDYNMDDYFQRLITPHFSLRSENYRTTADIRQCGAF